MISQNTFTENKPLVSIIVPSYNHGRFIVNCIESIVNQTYKNFELIVIDDGSVDSSRDILTQLQLKHRFTLIFQKNRGVSYTLNRGIKEFSKGEYITFCASDDYWAPNKLEKQIKFMLENRFYPMCYGKSYTVDENSKPISYQSSFDRNLKGGWIFQDIFLFNLHPPVNYLFRREIFDEIGFYDENLAAEDYDMSIRISSKYPIGFIDEYISYYRLTNVSFKVIRFNKISDSHLASIDKLINHPFYSKAKAMVYLRKMDHFSAFRSLKSIALANLIPSLRLFYHKRFMIAIIKLFILWKKVE